MEKELQEEIEKFRKDYKVSTIDQETETVSIIERINKILFLIFNDSSVTIENSLKGITFDKIAKRRKVLLSLKRIAVFSFLFSIVSFQIYESSSFYGSGAYSIYKAILTELCFIYINQIRATTIINKVMVGTVRISIFILMLFVVSSEVITQSKTSINSNNMIDTRIEHLKEAIQEKNNTIEYYKKRDWAISVNKHEKEKSELNSELNELQNRKISGENSEMNRIEEYKLYGHIAFRIILMVMVIIITRSTMY